MAVFVNSKNRWQIKTLGSFFLLYLLKSCYRNIENKLFYLIWNKYFFAAFIIVVDLRPNIVPSYLLVSLLNHGLVLNGRVNSFCKSCVVCICNQTKRQVCTHLFVCWFRLTFETLVATHGHLRVSRKNKTSYNLEQWSSSFPIQSF